MERLSSREEWHKSCRIVLAKIAMLWVDFPQYSEFWEDVTRRLEFLEREHDRGNEPEKRGHYGQG